MRGRAAARATEPPSPVRGLCVWVDPRDRRVGRPFLGDVEAGGAGGAGGGDVFGI